MIKEIQTAPGPASVGEEKPASGSEHLAEKHPVLLFTLPAGIVVFVLMVFPVFYTVYMSLHYWYASSVTAPEFIGLQNFIDLFRDSHYLASFRVTAVFSILVAAFGIVISLVLATMADRVLRGGLAYKTLLIWPYAVAPVTTIITG